MPHLSPRSFFSRIEETARELESSGDPACLVGWHQVKIPEPLFYDARPEPLLNPNPLESRFPGSVWTAWDQPQVFHEAETRDLAPLERVPIPSQGVVQQIQGQTLDQVLVQLDPVVRELSLGLPGEARQGILVQVAGFGVHSDCPRRLLSLVTTAPLGLLEQSPFRTQPRFAQIQTPLLRCGLTGLDTLFPYLTRLRALRKEEPQGVLFQLELEGFRDINGSFGFSVGDQVLRFFAAWIRARVPGAPRVARVGQDQFVWYLPGASSSEAEAVVDELRDFSGASFAPARELSGLEDRWAQDPGLRLPGLRLGLVLARPEDREEWLLARAAQAATRAREARSRVAWFEPGDLDSHVLA